MSKQLLKKGIGLGILTISPYIIALGMQVFYANQLSVQQVGMYATIGIFISMMLAFSNWNGDKYIISKRDVTSIQINETFTFEIFSSLFLFLITLTFFRNAVDNFIGFETSNLFWVGILCISIYFPLSRSKAILEKKLEYVSAYSPIFFANIIAGIIGAYCVFQGFGFWSMVIWKIALHIIEVFILFFVAPYRPRLRFNFSNTPEILIYCWPIFLGAIISFLATNLDKILVTTLMSERELGIYWLAFSLSHIPVIFRELLARLLLPILSKQDSDKAKIFIFDKLNGILQIVCVLSAIFITYWSQFFFDFVVGEKWAEAVPIFIVLFYAAIFKLVGGTSATLLFSAMKTRIAFDISVVGLFILVPFMYIGITYGGLTGAAISVLASTILVTIIAFETAVKGYCNQGFFYYHSYLLINVVACYLVMVFIISPSDDILNRLLASLFSIIFAIIMVPINNVLKRAISSNSFNEGDK